MRMRPLLVGLCFSSALWPVGAQAQRNGPAPSPPPDARPYSPTLEDLPYPYPVHYLPLTMYGHDVRMAFMDVPPAGDANGRTVVLLHGMNFFGEYWSNTIEVLRKAGFRVVVPDQIGFGRSSKPVIPYTFSDMAANTRKVLETVGIARAAIVGHSMGGMLAARFALLYPDATERLVLYNQIGLTDARLERQPPNIDQAYKAVLTWGYQNIYGTISRYFVNGIPKAAEKYLAIEYGWTLSGSWPQAAMVRALVQQMVYEDPVVYDWAHIKAKTLEIGGDKDGPNFPELARRVAKTIPNCELVLIPNIGHVPHFEAPGVFHQKLVEFLTSP
jgi:pimeloyl-ACP methyl ester carboxylesterase